MKIEVEHKPSNHYTRITHKYRKNVFINDPQGVSLTSQPTHTMPLIEFVELNDTSDHDLLCDCVGCNETFGEEQERLYSMEMERENKAIRERVNSYGPTI